MKEIFTNKDVQIQYSLIGEFVVRFEDINDWYKFIIPRIIFQKNHTDLQKRNINSLTENITANPLRTKFDSLIADNFKDYPQLSKLNNKLSAKLANLPEIRNSIVHGSYRLGWKDFEGNLSSETLSIQHSKSTKKGFEKRSKIISTKKLEDLIKDMKAVSRCYNFITGIIGFLTIYNSKDQADKYILRLENEIKFINTFNLDEIDILN